MRMAIIGAGISGIMAARYFSNYNPTLIEKNETLPFLSQNHASIRVKSEEIGILLNIKLKKVQISKQIFFEHKLYNQASITMKNLYSRKVTGEIGTRSIEFDDTNDIRYFFGEQLTTWPGLDYRTNHKLIAIIGNTLHFENKKCINYDICLSTIPMPEMFRIFKKDNTAGDAFKLQPIYVTELLLGIRSSAFQTIYFPELHLDAYRANLEENRLLIESLTELDDGELHLILSIFGLTNITIISKEVHRQPFGKIIGISDSQRKGNMLYLTENHNIYSLGRYATWRNGVEIDDVMKDLKKIKNFIELKTKEERIYEGRLD